MHCSWREGWQRGERDCCAQRPAPAAGSKLYGWSRAPAVGEPAADTEMGFICRLFAVCAGNAFAAADATVF